MTETNGSEKPMMYGQEVTEVTQNELLLRELLEGQLTANESGNKAFSSRLAWWNSKVNNPERNIAKECGYPDGFIPIDVYRSLYDHDAISARVVEVMPIESWQVQPSVFEDEDSETETPFEKAWKEVHKNLQSAYNPSKTSKPMQSFFQDESGSLVWSYLLRLDIRSGIGHYGLLLLGIDDGRDLRDPVEGFEDLDSEAFLGTDGMYGYNPFYPYTQGTDKYTQDQIQRSLEYKERVTGYKNRTGVGETPGGQAGYQLVPGVILPIDKETRRLVYLRVFDESLAQITRYERDPNNPRFGLPTMYLCTFNDPKNDPSSAAGLPVASSWVHWSRVIHFADKLGSNEVLAYPRMKQPYNRLLDLQKVYGASGEGFWQMAFAILSAETHPQLGGDVKMDVTGINTQVEKIRSGLKRHLLSAGVSWKSIAPVVSDPTAFKDAFIEAICIYLGCPIRVFKGSERGELASSQDDSSWNDRLRHRQNFLLTPRLIVPFVDRLIHMGILPEPKGYSVVWPDLESLSDKDKAAIFAQRMTGFSTYAQGVETIMTPMDMLTREADYTFEEAEAIIDSAQEVHDAEEGGMTPGMPGEEPADPVSGVKMKEGESLVHPSTGQPLTAEDADAAENQYFDPVENRWVTIQGTHVNLTGGGKIISGPKALQGKNVADLPSRSSKPASKSTATKTPEKSKPQAKKEEPKKKLEAKLKQSEKKVDSKTWAKSLPAHEKKSLLAYSGDDYTKIRNCQNKQVGCSPEVKTHIQNIKSALDKAPKHEGTTYRGLTFGSAGERAKFLAHVEKSGGLSDNGFLSTSGDHKTAKEFGHTNTATGYHGVMLHLSVKSGVDISHISKYPNEKEVLMGHPAKFKLKGLKKHADGTVIVEMEQI